MDWRRCCRAASVVEHKLEGMILGVLLPGVLVGTAVAWIRPSFSSMAVIGQT